MLLLPESARPLLGCTLRSVDYKSGGAQPPPQVSVLIERLVRCRGLRSLLSYCLGAIPRGGVMLLLPESARPLLGCTLRSVDYKSGGARPPPQVRSRTERLVRCRGLRGLLFYCLGAIPREGVLEKNIY